MVYIRVFRRHSIRRQGGKKVKEMERNRDIKEDAEPLQSAHGLRLERSQAKRKQKFIHVISFVIPYILPSPWTSPEARITVERKAEGLKAILCDAVQWKVSVSTEVL